MRRRPPPLEARRWSSSLSPRLVRHGRLPALELLQPIAASSDKDVRMGSTLAVLGRMQQQLSFL
jgi:hypothetical protein